MTCYYNGLEFKTRLEARWAAFFDLAGWSWQVNPMAVGDWRPDFKVTFPCGHSECGESHTLLVAVLACSDIDGVKGHPAFAHTYGVQDAQGKWLGDAGAVFGTNPSVSHWVMAHGAGGGEEDIHGWVDHAEALWARTEERITPAI